MFGNLLCAKAGEMVYKRYPMGSLVFLLFVLRLSVVLTSLKLIDDDLVGSLEGVLETSLDGVEASATHGLLLAAGLGALLLEGSNAGDLAGGEGLDLSLTHLLGSRVKDLHSSFVGKRVLLALVALVNNDLLSAELALDLVRVNDSGKISAAHHGPSELEARLDGGALSVGTEEAIELFESILGEDDESSEVTTRGELEEVDPGDVADINTGEVAGSLLDHGVLITVDDKGSLADGEASITEFTLASTEFLTVADAGKITGATEVVEALKKLGGLVLVE